jgi:hypothetical protein
MPSLVRNKTKFWGSLNYHSAAILTIIANVIKDRRQSSVIIRIQLYLEWRLKRHGVAM